jgi:hypothetical protein
MKKKLACSIKEMDKFRRMDSGLNDTHDASGRFKVTTLSAFSDLSLDTGMYWLISLTIYIFIGVN